MNALKAVVTLLVVLALCDVTGGVVGRRSGVSSLLGRFFSSQRGRGSARAKCDWESQPSLLKELNWAGETDLCFETGPTFTYPTAAVETALINDPDAAEFLGYLKSCYNYTDQSYIRGWNQQFYTQDVCPVRHRQVEMVWRYNQFDHRDEHCFVVHPHEQRLEMAQCGEVGLHADAQKCKMDAVNYFRGNYYCVPDGYVTRTALIYCPWDPEVQCRPAQVRIPTGCSCKKYACSKASSTAPGSLGSLAGITSRFASAPQQPSRFSGK